MMHG